ncbi:MAG: fibronectin type III domain-containing protein, partial [Clostridiales bacterium]|nr:fibronectin type III domain-containing protein [Clostridiales bacterium]
TFRRTTAAYDIVAYKRLDGGFPTTTGELTNAHPTMKIGYNVGEELDPFNPVTDLAVTVENSSAILTWTAPEANTNTLEEYVINRDDVELATVTELTYTDANLDNGTYEYTVVAVYEEGAAEASNAVTATIDNTPVEVEAPFNLTASVSGQDVTLNWLAPGTVLPDEITEGFEESWPPAGWSVNTTNTIETWARYETLQFTSGNVVPTEGMYQAGVMWDFGHQDEWLITPEISNVTNLTFDYYGSTGSTHGDNYHVKVSTNNGSTWTSVWNATNLPAGENHYDTPVTIDLSAYATETIKVAWNFVDGDQQGLWWATYIDNIIFESQGRAVAFDSSELKAFSKAEPTTVASNVRNIKANRFAKDPNYVSTRTTRDLTGYRIYRDEEELATIAANLLTYTDEDLDFGNYEYFVTAIYDEGESDPTNTVEVSIVDISTTFPPQNLTATVTGSDVALNWEAPLDLSEGTWITKGAEENSDGIGTGGAAFISVSQRYTEAELAMYQGMYINSIKFFPREAGATYTIKIWGGTAGNVELYSQAVTNFVNEAWNEYALNSSIAIPASGPIFIGYDADTPTGFPAGCDAGPAVPGGDLIKLDNQPAWDSIASMGLNFNWNIQAFVSPEGGDRVVTDFVPLVKKSVTNRPTAQLVRGNLDPITTTNFRFDRAVTGYKVYRDAAEIAEVGATVLTYLDTDLANGTYQYHVTAMYGDAESFDSNVVTVTVNNFDPDEILIADSFETYQDFVLQFDNWTLVDGDLSPTYGFTGVSFIN